MKKTLSHTEDVDRSCAEPSGSMPDGSELIMQERDRQVTVEGWTEAHDDEEHSNGELVLAAMAYANHAREQATLTDTDESTANPACWPWGLEWWKPSDDPMRNLVKAGALIAAEIDRLQRGRASNTPAQVAGKPTHEHGKS